MSDPIKMIPQITTGRPSTHPAAPSIRGPEQPGESFSELLRKSLSGATLAPTRQLTFSKHAQARVAQRGVEISQEGIQKLEDAIDLAREKGITDCLAYLEQTAYIVNVPSKVVVTVVDSQDSSVFTNIDGAVIL